MCCFRKNFWLDATDQFTQSLISATDNGLNAVENCMGRTFECLSDTGDQIADGVKYAADRVGCGAKCAVRGTKTFFIQSGSSMKKGAVHVGTYIKNNWQKLTLYLVAWALIVVASGALWGFKRTALPLTIGISAGLGFGLLTAILTAKVFDPKNKAAGKNTAWSLFFHKYNALEFVTRQIMLTVVTTVFLALCMKFPHTGGAVAGVVMGNHLFTYMLLNNALKKTKEETDHNPATIEELQNQRDSLKDELQKSCRIAEERLNELQEDFERRLQILENRLLQRVPTEDE